MSSSSGGGGGASFFFYYFLPPFSSAFFSATGAGLAASLATGPDETEPPKLKKEATSCPWRAFAKSLDQYPSTLMPAALMRVLIFSPE